jgi:hypothetical protein
MTVNKMNRNKFDDAIKNKLENYSLPVDSSSWSEIEKRLNAKPEKRALWPWISGIAVAAAIAAIWLIIPFNKQLIYYDTAEQQQLPHHEERITKDVLERKNVPFPPLSAIRTKPVSGRKEKNPEFTEIPAFPEHHVIAQTEVPPPVDVDSLETEEEKPLISPFGNEEEWADVNPIVQNKKSAKSVSFLVGSGSFLAMNNSPSYPSGLRSDNKFLNSNWKDELSDFDEVTHFLPLTFGLNFRKEINTYLSVESGLAYTYLYSKFKNKLPKQDVKMELHYLGIPVNLIANIYRNNHSKWTIYASAGGMVEKGLLSHYEERTSELANAVYNTIANEKIDGLQWSIHAALGIDYKIMKNYSIYFEPKVNYYLDNNQPVNARTEHPLILGINAGIRYTW